MEMHQLRYFVAVAEELHFGRAAERENISQPPLSFQIKKLEQELNVQLFKRTKRKVELTEAGALLLPQARTILADVQSAKDTASLARRGEIGRVRIGFVHSASLGYLPQLLEPFRAEFPRVEIHLDEMTVTEQLVALKKKQIDIGVLRPPIADPELTSFNVVEENFVLVVPKTHPLAGTPSVELSSLAHEHFVFYPEHRSPAFFAQLTKMCQLAGFSPKISVQANTMYTAIGLVGTGAGIGFIPESVACITLPSVSFVKLSGTDNIAKLDLVYSETGLSKSAAQVVEFARNLL
ncbi:LysR substrate-binding domain-containing protein [Cognatishimia sp. SS12]|uniref:LysR substrate-binding domain-containing protein n=1 Tax=Cognatishimia sp. SS12 TaxID=2979465 RepID=UPI00232CA2A3|nr:LysR substrate-binding domain-containing protein [Cognatishimia sp. SS12]MDC0738307.1 LysR substrate-binding domain-containing protein [Cognatishimia sp. SS12]